VKTLALRSSGLLCCLALGCSRNPQPEQDKAHDEPTQAASSKASEDHADEGEHEDLPTRVRLDPEVVKAAQIETTPVVREVLASTLDLPGEITSDPDKTAKVSALLPGRIESVHFKEGETVQKGAVLILLQVPELGKAKAAYTSTLAKASAARTNADRLRALADKRLAANQEVLTATAEAESLEAEARAAGEQLSALGTGLPGREGSTLALRAPKSGLVVSRDAVVGQPVAAEQTLATIADLSEVWFLGSVFEKNLAQVRLGAPAEIALNAYPEARFSGSVEYLSRQIDPVARTVTARIRLANRDDLLRLGLFGVAHVTTSEPSKREAALVVPRSAVTEIAQKQVVFVQQSDGDFDLHQIALGGSGLGKVEVISGLREGEQVVRSGVFTLKSAVLKSTFGEDDE
jgi:cobalt-zinc-cadmium efflux system membrane fusion protein